MNREEAIQQHLETHKRNSEMKYCRVCQYYKKQNAIYYNASDKKWYAVEEEIFQFREEWS